MWSDATSRGRRRTHGHGLGCCCGVARVGARLIASGLVTILFTDLVGSTDHASEVGDNAADELRRDHFASLREAVAATGDVVAAREQAEIAVALAEELELTGPFGTVARGQALLASI